MVHGNKTMDETPYEIDAYYIFERSRSEKKNFLEHWGSVCVLISCAIDTYFLVAIVLHDVKVEYSVYKVL